MARGMLSQTRSRIDEATNDPRVLNAPLTLVMRVYSLSYANARAAIEAARERARKDRALTTAVKERTEIDALVFTVRNAEEAYPTITSQAVASVNHAELGKKFSLSRERVRQIGEAVRRLAVKLGKTEREVATLAAKNKLPRTQREELAATIAD
jgi:predicted  nucleic acid-binding Zn-ribbon protein